MDSSDQWNNAPEQQGGSGGIVGGDEDDQPAEQMPLGLESGWGGDEAGLGDESVPLTSAPQSRRRISSGVVLLLVVIAVAGATLWAMREAGKVDSDDAAVAEAAAKIDKALKRLSGSDNASEEARAKLNNLFKDTDEILARFAHNPAKKQVTLKNLRKNPFTLATPKPEKSAEEKESADDKQREQAQQKRRQRRRQLRNKLKELTLQSVLSGSPSVAVISGEVLRTGQTVGPFTVTSISPDGVRLAADGNTYTLQMERSKQKKR